MRSCAYKFIIDYTCSSDVIIFLAKFLSSKSVWDIYILESASSLFWNWIFNVFSFLCATSTSFLSNNFYWIFKSFKLMFIPSSFLLWFYLLNIGLKIWFNSFIFSNFFNFSLILIFSSSLRLLYTCVIPNS